jgi:hypothetical protein
VKKSVVLPPASRQGIGGTQGVGGGGGAVGGSTRTVHTCYRKKSLYPMAAT